MKVRKFNPDAKHRVDSQAEIQRWLREHQEQMKSLIEPITRLAASEIDRINAQVTGTYRTAQTINEAYSKHFGEFADEIQERVRQEVEAFSREALESFPVLAKRGWYSDLRLTSRDLATAVETLNRGRYRKADRLLSEYFEARIPQIKASLIERFPQRGSPLRSAFWAHRRKRYSLAIPVFLAQADGICAELLGVSLFQRKNGAPVVAAVIEGAESPWTSFLIALVMPTPISASAAERALLPGVLNRHAVFHGESSDYGTRINSCKAISLLAYIEALLPLLAAAIRRQSQKA